MQYLIIGKGAKESALAKKIKEQQPDDIVFVAPGNQAIGDFATCIDIQSNDTAELVDFAQANEVDITIISDSDAIETGVADAFNSAGLMVFAPEQETARIATHKSAGKRFMYKLKIPTSKFGIFDKEASAREYIRNADFPILLKKDKHCDYESTFLCHSAREANTVLNKFFTEENEKVIIENYVNGREFSFYAFTDGYNAIPICSTMPYKYFSEKDGGSITKGVGAYAPCTFVNEELTIYLLDKVIYPTLNEIEKNAAPYVGIIGIDAIINDKNEISVIEFNTFFNEPDIECILELIDENLIKIFKACTVGSLADDYEIINMKNKASVSIVLTKTPKVLFDNETSVLFGLDKIDEDINITLYNAINKENSVKVKAGRALSMTASASTLNKAKTRIKENIDDINFEGKRYRKDILNEAND